jgi:hypothetical protein
MKTNHISRIIMKYVFILYAFGIIDLHIIVYIS